MSARRHRACWLFAGLCAGSMYLAPLNARQLPAGQPSGSGAPPAGKVSGPGLPAPIVHSPIQIFRNLLAQKPEEREQALGKFPVEKRQPLLAKVLEYEAMKPEEREERLRTTELRWYLLLFMRSPATNRPVQLASVPEGDRRLVGDRIQQWDLLSSAQQKEVLEYESTLQYFVPRDGARTTNAAEAGGLNGRPGELTKSVDRWNSLTVAQREEMQTHFDQFFRLTPGERQEILPAFSAADRLKMARSLQVFARLPEARRELCLKAFTKFAGLSRAERDEFLKNAERWKEMSSAERQAWQNLVERFPSMPPLPFRGPMPPLPRPAPIFPPASPQVTTNTDQQPP